MIIRKAYCTEYKWSKKEQKQIENDIQEPVYECVALLRWLRRKELIKKVSEEEFSLMEHVVNVVWKKRHYK